MSLPFYRLQQLISPSLPIGAFTYSQGMEWAVEYGWIKNREDLSGWLESCLLDSLAQLELPILERLLNALNADDKEAFFHWSHVLYASRETSELRTEETQRARAMLTVLEKLHDTMPENRNMNSNCTLLHTWNDALCKTQLAPFALACHLWGIGLDEAVKGYTWAWLENMVSVAVKLVPLGQSDGQKTLFYLSGHLDGAALTARAIEDEEIGASTIGMAIASSLHETQYCRLFRS